jgi:hypothetical protein
MNVCDKIPGYRIIELLSAHSDAAVVLFSAVLGALLGCFGSYWLWHLERRRQRRIARKQVVINLRHWMKRSLDQVSDVRTYEDSGGAGGTQHSRIPNFRFEKSLEVIALLEPKVADRIFELIDDKDNANGEVQVDIEYQDADEAIGTFRGRSAQVWLAALKIYYKVSAQVGWSERAFSDEDKVLMQEEIDRFEKRAKDRAKSNAEVFSDW